jgi:hypothetical protein
MTADLGFLPAWYGSEGDYVLCEGGSPVLPEALCPTVRAVDTASLRAGLQLPPLLAAPWGISLPSLRMFRDLKREYLPEMDVPAWSERYAELSGRQTAALCLEEIRRRLPLPIVPDGPKFFSDPEEVAQMLAKASGGFVLKAPYSSSGRGLLWMQGGGRPSQSDMQRIVGIIRRQGYVGIEQALDRSLDFALEFYADGKGNVSYEGLSVFHANEKGVYKHNRLAPQDELWKLPEACLGDRLRELLPEAVAGALGRLYAPHYAGYLGVDMFVYRTAEGWRLHPCVEVNLRCTMGWVAVRLFDSLIDADARGRFFVDFHKDGALDSHLLMQARYPLQISDGKLSGGYISLCPVNKSTRYVAGIILADINKNK